MLTFILETLKKAITHLNTEKPLRVLQVTEEEKAIQLEKRKEYQRRYKIENKEQLKHKRDEYISKNIDKIIEERKQFCEDVSNNEIKIDDAISIDEVSFCVDEVKNYGFSKKNKEIKKLLKHKHNKERLSVITAIDKNGVIAYEIHDKSVNGDKYLDFFKKNKDHFKDRYTLQDNIRFHRYYKLKEFALENNIILQYIPAYTRFIKLKIFDF
jgi:hypothetical protein